MKETFTIGNRMYERHYHTAKEIATKILPRFYGKNLESLTYGELATITKMYNHGWTLHPTYTLDYKNNTETLVPQYKLFTLFCDEDTVIHQYTCFLLSDDIVELYDNNKQICRFTSIDNMFSYMKQLDDTEPLKVSEYYHEKVVKNLEGFDDYGLDGEIYTENAKVFDDSIYMCDLTFELDNTKCDEIKLKSAEI